MPEYAVSKALGFPIYYEVLSLDEALAEEAAANDEYRDDFGLGFDDYLASQLDLVRSTYAAGMVRATAYSIRAPTGEFTTSLLFGDVVAIEREQFEFARLHGYPEPDR